MHAKRASRSWVREKTKPPKVKTSGVFFAAIILCITLRYISDMIQSTKGKRAEKAVKGDYGKGFPANLVRRTRAMLTAMDAATTLEDLRFPPGNHLEALRSNRSGQHSVRINNQWRICFIWTSNGPAEVEIVDYH
ncbi:MAG: type II toxin-antitoxin system RelE/ParE family toxin [Ahrensia sp.]